MSKAMVRKTGRAQTEEHCLRTAIGVAMKTTTKNLSQKPLLHLRISNGAHQSTGGKGLIQDFGGFLFDSVCYGGLHLTACNAPFPTATQQFLWKLASLSLVVAGPLLVLYFSLMVGMDFLADYVQSQKQRLTATGVRVYMWLFFHLIELLMILAVYYVFCRAFLIVECLNGRGIFPTSVDMILLTGDGRESGCVTLSYAKSLCIMTTNNSSSIPSISFVLFLRIINLYGV